MAGIASLGLYTAAYVAEALRSGVFSVSKGQIEAALSLGFTYPQTLRRIVLPQAFRTVISPLGLADHRDDQELGDHRRLAARARRPAQDRAASSARATFEIHEAFLWAAVGYLILTGLRHARDPLPREALRDAADELPLRPDNWEWLVTGNNLRFILEGFLVNLEIAVDRDGARR